MALSNDERYSLAEIILKNLEDEAGAQSGYYDILRTFPGMDESDKKIILEIISDESQHLLRLHNMQLKYGKAVIASDGTKELFNELIDKISDN